MSDRHTQEQKARIRAVIDRLKQEGAHFSMNDWVSSPYNGPVNPNRAEWCGTTACIWGHALLDAGYVPYVRGCLLAFEHATLPRISRRECVDAARTLMGLPAWVFYEHQWPTEVLFGPGTSVQDAVTILTRLLNDSDSLWERT
jgi:hypothetical protein